MKTPVINFITDNPKEWNKKELKLFKDRVRFITKKIFSLENKMCDTINLILTDNKKIKELNKKYLNHNYETDVLTFRYEDKIIEADMIVSCETVKGNSIRFNTDFLDELFRVVIHGLLHICGYKDGTRNERKFMREKEDYYLNFLNT